MEQPKTIVTRHTIAESKKRRVHLLLAEDHIANQKVALGILGKLGYRADAVVNGVEAIKALETIPYDLVLMDCQMPEMDGYEATGEIRNPKSKVLNHKIPIIAMTAHTMQGDREKCIEAGMNDYVTKPVNPQELIDAIERWLTESDVLQPDETASESTPAEDILDKAALVDRLMGDEDLAKEIIEGFIKDIPNQIRVLNGSLGDGNAPLVKRQAHTIKGASSNIGAMALYEVAYQIEIAGEEGDLQRAASLTGKLDKQFDILRKTLELSESTGIKGDLL